VAAMEALTTVKIDTERIAKYIESCQTEDGGFFFARIPPSGAADTCYAVNSLRLLGRKPVDPEAVIGWLRDAARGSLVANPKGVFFLVETGLVMGVPTTELRRWADRLRGWSNAEGGFGAWRNVDVEASSELDITYRATITMLDLGMGLDYGRLSRFLFRFLNDDGGFGVNGFSTLASTFYAVQILSRLGVLPQELYATVEWLCRREALWDVPYLEHLYWLASSLNVLGVAVGNRSRALDFALDCQHHGGGFARARYGIATLENTHYALEVLSVLEVI